MRNLPTGPTVFTSTSHVVATWSERQHDRNHLVGCGRCTQRCGRIRAPVGPQSDHDAQSSHHDGGDQCESVRRWPVGTTTTPICARWTTPATGLTGAWHLGPFYIHGGAPGCTHRLDRRACLPGPTRMHLTSPGRTRSNVPGIAGAYYKLDSPPLFETDGAWVAGDDIESLEGMSRCPGMASIPCTSG